MVATICPGCGAALAVKPYKVRNGGRPYCSRSCYARHRVGPLNSNWRGGQIVMRDGRVLVYCPGHPEAKHQGGGVYALRYRLVAMAMLGRPLKADEVVHHINGDASDDRPENLAVMTQSQHARLELAEKRCRDFATGRLL